MDDLPLYEVKADLFRGLAHPLRVRILELVCAADEVPVADLLTELKLKPPHLSQHLAVLAHTAVVRSRLAEALDANVAAAATSAS